MISSIKIENFRGIRSGHLQGIAPLTVLTGPNGCGKSSVLDALLIGSSPTPSDAVGRAVNRHPQSADGSRWLFSDRSKPAKLLLTSTEAHSPEISRQLIWIEIPDIGPEIEALTRRRAPGPYRQISTIADEKMTAGITIVAFDNRYEARKLLSSIRPVPFVRMVDSSIAQPLDRTFSEVWRQGKRDEIINFLAPLIEDLKSIDILTEDNGSPRLYLTRALGAVPVSMSGDGIQALIQILLELSLAGPKSLVLFEEPEVFLHTRAIYQCGRALVEGMRQGRQVVLTTHNLELIDAILGYSTVEENQQIALFNLRIKDGILESGRFDGKEMRTARNVIEEDLR